MNRYFILMILCLCITASADMLYPYKGEARFGLDYGGSPIGGEIEFHPDFSWEFWGYIVGFGYETGGLNLFGGLDLNLCFGRKQHVLSAGAGFSPSIPLGPGFGLGWRFMPFTNVSFRLGEKAGLNVGGYFPIFLSGQKTDNPVYLQLGLVIFQFWPEKENEKGKS